MAKVKFNPSTGKVSFNPSTGKVAMAVIGMPSVCGWCDTSMPEYLTLNLSNFADVACCDYTCGAANASSGEAIDVAVALNSKSYNIPWSSGCVYYDEVDGSFGGYKAHWVTASCDAGCTNRITDWWYHLYFKKLKFTITLTETGITIVIDIYVDGTLTIECNSDPRETASQYLHLFSGTITYAEGEECGDTAETASNTITSCTNNCVPPEYSPCANSGTASISIP